MRVLLLGISLLFLPLSSGEQVSSDHETLMSARYLKKIRDRFMRSSGWEDNVYSNVISVHCLAAPVFSCEHDKISCGERVMDEQNQVIQEIQSRQSGAKVVAQTHKLVNAIFVALPNDSVPDLGGIAGVKHVLAHTVYDLGVESVVDYIGVPEARAKYCATGKGVKVAVLDTGIDYTHEAFGGEGTVRAYKRAYGRNASSIENTSRDGLFPTERVIDGYDFLGLTFDPTGNVMPDDDPIDAHGGHGTSVASAITAVAPDAELVAVKVCSKVRGCPQFAILQGLEYALDPNGDNSTEDKVRPPFFFVRVGGIAFHTSLFERHFLPRWISSTYHYRQRASRLFMI